MQAKSPSPKSPSLRILRKKEWPEPAVPWLYLRCRRVVEVVLIVLFSPLLILTGMVIALGIVLETKGGCLFIQPRPGKNGCLFHMYKFRTMYRNADDSFLTQRNDVRVTRIGTVLRKYRLDEIPQFLNVLKGDMSLIGPRPVPANLFAFYIQEIPGYNSRHLIKPGITGYAQVIQGYTSTLEEEAQKFQYDMEYIARLSSALDWKITVATLQRFIGIRSTMSQGI